MGLDIYLMGEEKDVVCHCCGHIDKEKEELHYAGITHNLCEMAREAGIYEALWRPHRLKKGYNIPENNNEAEWEFENNTETKAKELIPTIEKGLKDLKKRPEYFKKFNSPNGWGMYKNFVPFIEKYLGALKENPESIVTVSR